MSGKEKLHFMDWTTSSPPVSSREAIAAPVSRKSGRYEGLTPEALEAMFAEVCMDDAHELLAPQGAVGKEQVDF